MEEWKDIEGYEYEISKSGQVRNKQTNKILKNHFGKRGYYTVQLHKDKKVRMYYIHRLIAQAFIPNPSNKKFVDHIDRNRKNNSINNLRWVNSIENAQNNDKVVNKSTGEIYIQQYFKVTISNEVLKFQNFGRSKTG